MENLSLGLLLSSFLFISYYIIQIASTHKALKSFSESDYWLRTPWKWTFEFILIFSGLSLIYSGYTLGFKYMLMLAGVGAVLVGVFSRFKKNSFFKIAHWFGALCIFIGLSLSGWIDFNIWYTIILPIITLISTSYFKNKGELIWYLELNLIYTTFPVIFFILLFR